MAHESKVYINTESYYPGHKRLPTDLPIEVTGDGTLENPYTPVQGAGGGISSIVAGSGITVDATDPANPEVSATGGSGYLVYTALLNQSDTDAPTATVLENTLGGTVVWTRGTAGSYFGTLASAFPINKTFGIIQNNLGEGADFSINNNEDNNSMVVGTSFNDDAGDDLLFYTPVEIRVYP